MAKVCRVCWLEYHAAHKRCPDCEADGVFRHRHPSQQTNQKEN